MDGIGFPTPLTELPNLNTLPFYSPLDKLKKLFIKGTNIAIMNKILLPFTKQFPNKEIKKL
jgi:hypothetical protein